MEYSEEGQRLKDTKACYNTRTELKMCLLESDCCKLEKRTPRDCLSDPSSDIPEECRRLRLTMFECKRSLLDMRNRFRGRKYN